jgi:phosphatidylglycerophosphate synthase
MCGAASANSMEKKARMKFTFKDLLENHIASDDDVYVRITVYPFAVPLTWVILNFTSISANTITLTGLVFGVTGCLAAVVTQQLWYLGLGFCLFLVCDFVDGQVASARGKTQFGAMLDLTTDRTVILLAVLSLGMRHASLGQSLELFLLLCYFGLCTYVDLVLFAKHRAVAQHGTTAGPRLPAARVRERGRCMSIWTLFPSRLSSQVALILVFALTGSSLWAYSAALCFVIGEYVKLALKLCILIFARFQG